MSCGKCQMSQVTNGDSLILKRRVYNGRKRGDWREGVTGRTGSKRRGRERGIGIDSWTDAGFKLPQHVLSWIHTIPLPSYIINVHTVLICNTSALHDILTSKTSWFDIYARLVVTTRQWDKASTTSFRVQLIYFGVMFLGLSTLDTSMCYAHETSLPKQGVVEQRQDIGLSPREASDHRLAPTAADRTERAVFRKRVVRLIKRRHLARKHGGRANAICHSRAKLDHANIN